MRLLSPTSADHGATIGPQSVGHRLVTEGLVFGGQTLTATDIVVAAGSADVGDRSRTDGVDPEVIDRGIETIQRMLDENIEKMKPSSKPLPVILVGGGAVLVTRKLKAASDMLCPEHSGVANAIGAAIAQIGGEAERLVNYRELPREEAIDAVSREATDVAVAAGADLETIRIADIEETSISYMAEGSTKLRIKAVGDIAGLPSPAGGANK